MRERLWCGGATRLGKERKGGDPTAVVPKELSSEKFLVGIGSRIEARLAMQGCNLHFVSRTSQIRSPIPL